MNNEFILSAGLCARHFTWMNFCDSHQHPGRVSLRVLQSRIARLKKANSSQVEPRCRSSLPNRRAHPLNHYAVVSSGRTRESRRVLGLESGFQTDSGIPRVPGRAWEPAAQRTSPSHSQSSPSGTRLYIWALRKIWRKDPLLKKTLKSRGPRISVVWLVEGTIELVLGTA